MALKIDKETLLEIVSARKDEIVILVLLVLLGVGGWLLYQESSVTVDEYIRRVTETTGGGGNNTSTDELNPEAIVQKILEKRKADFYSTSRNPFGSAQEYLQKRRTIENAYQRGVELFSNNQYQAAIAQFEKVIELDVTETRIQYPVLPSEYKRRAQREYAKTNFDQIYQSAQSDLEEGDRLLSSGNRDQALGKYKNANDDLAEVINSDPQGKAIGEENFQKLTDLKQTAEQKLFDLWSTMLEEDIDREVSQANQVLGSQDYIALTKAYYQLSRVRVELNNADPNKELVSPQKHNQLNNTLEQIQTKIQSGISSLISQAQTTLQEGIAEADLQKTQDAIRALNHARQSDPTNQEIQQTFASAIQQRADLVIRLAQEFYTQQTDLLKQGNYDQFDQQGKARFISELQQLLDLGAVLSSDKRNQIAELIQNIRGLRLPPPVTEVFEVMSIEESSTGRYTIVGMDRSGRTPRERRLFLREGGRDSSSGIQLKEVDTEKGFVILSKSGYRDAQVALPSN